MTDADYLAAKLADYVPRFTLPTYGRPFPWFSRWPYRTQPTRILAYLKERRSATVRQIASDLDINPDSVRTSLAKLKTQGVTRVAPQTYAYAPPTAG